MYAKLLARLLADRGDTVHVIGQLWEKSADRGEGSCHGRLIVHRVPYEDGASVLPRHPHPALDRNLERSLFASEYPPQCFAWQAALLAERLVEDEGIDLIESQEYEAPLYFIQLRRALGLGPSRRPPCLVHLHSPTEFIARHNGWDQSLPGILAAKRFEDYSIASADALLCPSRYLARQAEAHYGLAKGAVTVIPYPMGDGRVVPRGDATWAGGTVCYTGRLEPRKGVLELIEAATCVAREHPTVRFVFVGGDTIHRGVSVRAMMERRIPADLRPAFRFFGERAREMLPQWLAEARIAVVPSRWENFPNSCIEAMASGLPVMATREGGMAEMIEDGETGWLSDSAQPDQLAPALRRALATPPGRLAEMGRQAAAQIRSICDKNEVAQARASFHNQIVRQGAVRSPRLPTILSRGATGSIEARRECDSQFDPRSGIAVVVTFSGRSAQLEPCLRSLAQQTQQPAAVVVARHGADFGPNVRPVIENWLPDAHILPGPFTEAASARNTAIDAIDSAGHRPLGIVFLSENDRIKPLFVAGCESVLKACPEVGLVSCWTASEKDSQEIWIKPCPALPYQWLSNDAVPFSAVRTEALCEAGRFRPVLKPGYDHWDLFNAVLAKGWVGVTIPEVLAESPFCDGQCPHLVNSDPATRAELLGRFPELVARDFEEIMLSAISSACRLSRPFWSLWGERLSWARVMLRYPRTTGRQVYRRLRNKVLRFRGRVLPSTGEVT